MNYKSKDIPSYRKGFVYVIYDKINNLYKIGRYSKWQTIKNRLSVIRSSNPGELELVYLVKSEDYKNEEKLIHRFFKDKRFKGEWFDLTEDDLKLIPLLYTRAQRRHHFLYKDLQQILDDITLLKVPL